MAVEDGLRHLGARRIALEDLPGNSLVREFDAYWRTAAPSATLPNRTAIDPIRIGPRLLPWLFLMEVKRTGDSLDYRYRLVGTENANLVGRDATGMMASEIFHSAERSFMIESFDITVREALPTFWRAVVPQDRVDLVTIYRGLFPFAGENGSVDLLAGVAVPEA